VARHPKGSTPTLTEKLIDELCAAVRNGAYIETAAALSGISKDSFYRWLRQADDEDAPALTKELSYAVKKALAEAEMRDLDTIGRAADGGQWQAAAWRLERKFPEKWGRKTHTHVELSGRAGGPIQIEEQRRLLLEVMGDAESLKAAELIAEKLTGTNESEE
jgi:transposase